MPNMNESNCEGQPVYCPHCGRLAFTSGHSMIYSETPIGGQMAAQSGKVFYRCICGSESETDISMYTGRLFLREFNQRSHWARSNDRGNRGGGGGRRR